MQGQINFVAAIGGVSLQATITKTGDGSACVDPSLPAGKAGTLTTRTDDNTGEATLSGGHGILTGDTVDVYWDGGMRYGMTVGTVATNVVPIDGGTGDNLPAATTALVVCKQVEVDCEFNADDAQLMAASCLNRSHLIFVDGSDVEQLAVEIAANGYWSWVAGQGVTNPLAGHAIAKLKVSNGQSDAAATFKLAALLDSTP